MSQRNPMSTSGKRKLRVSRDTVLFTVGILGIIYETLVTAADRPTLLILFGAMCGLPVFLRSDEYKVEHRPPEQPAQPTAPAPAEQPLQLPQTALPQAPTAPVQAPPADKVDT
jgi:hypothetical protein